ncbi:radical SAM protein [bacterium]|nr:radical SAM protein [bacterium]
MSRTFLKPSEKVGYLPETLVRRVDAAARVSWENFGRRVTFYLPGMFHLYGQRGKYPAVSVTGAECELNCKHCRGKLLLPMPPARTAEEVVRLAEDYKRRGILGILLSGGSTKEGYVPLEPIIPAIPRLKEMGFFVSAHTGFTNYRIAKKLRDAGVDQVIFDVVGDDRTMADILNLPQGTQLVRRNLEIFAELGLRMVPHIIIGLGGKIVGEYRALELLRGYPIELLVFVVLMPAVAMKHLVDPIPLEDAVEVIVTGREMFPNIEQSLGCARPRGAYRYQIEHWALRAGINRMALWSEAAEETARSLGLDIRYQLTCCSVPLMK